MFTVKKYFIAYFSKKTFVDNKSKYLLLYNINIFNIASGKQKHSK